MAGIRPRPGARSPRRRAGSRAPLAYRPCPPGRSQPGARNTPRDDVPGRGMGLARAQQQPVSRHQEEPEEPRRAFPRRGRARTAWPRERTIESIPGKRDPDALLFPRYAHGKGYYPPRSCWRAVCADAKLDRLRLHDLRHTMASHAVMSGENLPLVGRLLGHQRHRTTAGYAHLADRHLVEAAEKVGKIIAEAIERAAS